MSEFQNQGDQEPDFRTEPGIWLQKLVYGLWEIVTNSFFTVLMFVACMAFAVIAITWLKSDDWERERMSRIVEDFETSFLREELVTENSNYVSITYTADSLPLTDVRFTVGVTARDGKMLEIDQYRALWQPQERIQIDVPLPVPIEKMKVLGTAERDGEPVEIGFVSLSSGKSVFELRYEAEAGEARQSGEN